MFANARTCISVSVLVLFSSVGATQTSMPQDREAMIYSSHLLDEYRNIKYWGEWSLYVRDYNRRTGDAEYLQLGSQDPESSIDNYIPNKQLVDHFNKECQRLLTNKRPLNSLVAARKKWRDEFLKEYGGASTPDFIERYHAYEEAKIRAEFGPNPGMVRCAIAISRRTFPVLYEMTSSFHPGLDVRNTWTEEEKLGYSTPDDIVNELKASITEQLEALSKELAKIDRYSSR
jgi:hypothetical protein